MKSVLADIDEQLDFPKKNSKEKIGLESIGTRSSQ